MNVKVDILIYRPTHCLLQLCCTPWTTGNLLCSENNNWRRRTSWIALVHSEWMSYSCARWACRSTSFPSTGYRGRGGGRVWCARDSTYLFITTIECTASNSSTTAPTCSMFTINRALTIDHFMMCSVSFDLTWQIIMITDSYFAIPFRFHCFDPLNIKLI